MRIPIGYWAFQIESWEPYCQGQLPYLQQAIQWARQYGIKVLIDLHGAPGSQNGYVFQKKKPQSLSHLFSICSLRYDNSGHRLSYPQWQTNSTNISRTKAVVQQIASMFEGDADVVTGIEALNE